MRSGIKASNQRWSFLSVPAHNSPANRGAPLSSDIKISTPCVALPIELNCAWEGGVLAARSLEKPSLPFYARQRQ